MGKEIRSYENYSNKFCLPVNVKQLSNFSKKYRILTKLPTKLLGDQVGYAKRAISYNIKFVVVKSQFLSYWNLYIVQIDFFLVLKIALCI